ncbi:MAG: HAD-IA family hydrolase, partial [Candidatus Amulumruptor sp.]|nr:HAD-IA family hydrolase [Candidatus Amulumruptor sp.]
MKPAAEIFRIAAERCGIVPEETIFLDDSQSNLNAAAREGYHTLLVAPGYEFETLLEEQLAKS